MPQPLAIFILPSSYPSTVELYNNYQLYNLIILFTLKSFLDIIHLAFLFRKISLGARLNQIHRQIQIKIFKLKFEKAEQVIVMLKEKQLISLRTSNLILPSQCQQMFKQCNILVTRVSELQSGVKIAAVVNKVLYDDTNSQLRDKIIVKEQDKKGNQVINMNMVLRNIKRNTKHKFPDSLSSLTQFKIDESQQEMMALLKWLTECWKKNANPTKKGNKTGFNDAGIERSKQNVEINTEAYDEYQNQNYMIRNRKQVQNRQVLKPHKFQHMNHDEDEEMHPLDDQDQQNRGGQNIFENFYFCDRDLSPHKADDQLNDSLQMSEKVSKKGSFKVVRPRTVFEDKKNEPIEETNEKRMEDVESPEKEEAKFKTKGTGAQERYYSDQKQSSARKTIPKMAERPPLYKKVLKEQTKSQLRVNEEQQQIKIPTPFNVENSNQSVKKESKTKQKVISNQTAKNGGLLSEQRDLKSSELFKQISKIQEQIKRESLENTQSMKGHSRMRSNMQSRTKSSRKIFRVEIKEVSENQRKSIIQWLISINLLNSMATSYYDQFHEICKNGVIFPEILNHHLGRSGNVSYVKVPVKSAEIHSNYQKVFNCLKDIPNFESELLFMYEFFVPQVVENAFWSLLKSCQQCFQKNILKKSKVYTRESEIRQKLSFKAQSQVNSRVKTEKNQSKSKSIKKGFDLEVKEYQKIKYGSTNFKSITNKTMQFKNQTPKVSSLEKEAKSKRKSSFDFIRELPQKINNFKHEELVQAQEPIEINKVNKGYKDLHELKKSHNTSSFIKTPEKKLDNSMARSRINSTNSVKKLPQKPQSPSITLQMEMKALKYLKEKSYLNNNSLEPVPLFEDPIRNGVLLNKIIHDEVKISYKYHQKPRNIVDCKQNFTKGFTQLKQAFWPVPSNYEFYYQNIIKGEMTLFYGLIWHVLSMMNKGSVGIGALKNESAIMSISKNYNNPEVQLTQKTAEQILFWVRQIQQQNPLIADLQLRDFNQISTAIVGKNLLYKVATAIMPEKYTLKPTYETPINQMEQESNIKKVLSFLAHNKILRSELAWKAKSLVKKQKNTTIQILKQLMSYHKSVKKPILNLHPQNPVISFVKFARNNSKQEIKNPERANQRLQTTMANNSYPAVPIKKEQPQKKYDPMPIIEVPWMRSLGFSGDLALNSGVILCRLICKLTMRTLTFNENPSSKAECLTNIRKALKLIDKFKWDQEDIACADEKTTMQIYKFIKQKYKHCYALKDLN